MAYTAHTWVNGELITAERLNELEEAAAQAAQPGPEGKPGEPGVGLTGEAMELLPLAEDANSAAVLAKVNEIIAALSARGISKIQGV